MLGEGVQSSAGIKEAVAVEQDGKKHTIRSHHLRFEGWAMGLGELAGTPQSVAEVFADQVATWLTSNNSYYRRYAKTTVGVDKQQYVDNLASGLREFIDAPDDTEYTIVENVSDTIICGKMIQCGLGDHCRRRRAELSGGNIGIVDESGDTRTFIDAAEEMGLVVNVDWDKSDSIDYPQVGVRTITLSAGEIKEVLSFMAENKKYKTFFDDPFKGIK